jgi:hypothetical protein
MYLYKYNYSIIVSISRSEHKRDAKKDTKSFLSDEERTMVYPDKLFVPIKVFESMTP